MALGSAHKVVEDTPSEVVRLSRTELNKVMVVLESLVTEIEGAADLEAVQTAMTDVVQPLIALLKQVTVSYSERPAAHTSSLTPGA
jgi:uncharacterized UPF0146 family protein